MGQPTPEWFDPTSSGEVTGEKIALTQNTRHSAIPYPPSPPCPLRTRHVHYIAWGWGGGAYRGMVACCSGYELWAWVAGFRQPLQAS